VMLGGFPVVAGGMGEMFCCLLVVFRSFLRHGISSILLFQCRVLVNRSLGESCAKLINLGVLTRGGKCRIRITLSAATRRASITQT
jgi:hypothetical protein